MDINSISDRQMAAWNKSRVEHYDIDGCLDGYSLGRDWDLYAFHLGCVYYLGKVRRAKAWEFRIGDFAGTFVIWSNSLAKALRGQAEAWKKKHSGPEFEKRLLAAAEEVRPDFIRAAGLLYGSNGQGEFYMHDDRKGREVIVLHLDPRGYLYDSEGNQLKA